MTISFNVQTRIRKLFIALQKGLAPQPVKAGPRATPRIAKVKFATTRPALSSELASHSLSEKSISCEHAYPREVLSAHNMSCVGGGFRGACLRF